MPFKIGIVSNSKICLPLLSYLIKYNKAGVIFYLGRSLGTDNEKAEIINFCNANRITFHIEDKKEDLYQWQQIYEPDIIFITGYSYKIVVNQLSGVSKGVYNIHFGELPVFRGPSPVFWQLKNGVKEIGLCIHELSDKLDSGKVVWTYSLKNEDYHTYNYVNQLFSELQVKGVFELLERVSKNIPLIKKAQDENKAHYYKKPGLSDVMISWDMMDAKEIVDLVKACNSWNNGAITLMSGREFKIMDANIIVGQKTDLTAGTISMDHNRFHVSCVKGSLLSVNFFNINNTYIPAKHAAFYGLKTGQKFTGTM